MFVLAWYNGKWVLHAKKSAHIRTRRDDTMPWRACQFPCLSHTDENAIIRCYGDSELCLRGAGMRVLMLSWEFPPHVVGGMGKHVLDLAPALVQQGIEVHILTPLLRGGPPHEV